MGSTTVRLTRAEFQNFRGFDRLEVELAPEFNLILGANGAGKSSLIDGLAMAVGCTLRQQWGPKPALTDIRKVLRQGEGAPTLEIVEPCVVSMEASLNEWSAGWSVGISSVNGKTQNLPRELQAWWKSVEEGASCTPPADLPVFARYDSARAWSHLDASQTDTALPSRDEGWRTWWQPSTSFPKVSTWIRRQTFADLQAKATLPQLQAVRRAVTDCLGDVEDFFYDIRSEQLQVRLADGRLLPMALLSDGYRNVIAMVADLAWRAATLNPHLGAEAPARSPGIVLIDELDLHLHPAWQRRVIGDLRRTFPAMQFVATTHSPQVLASARREWVRLLDGGPVARIVAHVQGRDSNSLLEDVFGVPERPDEDKAALALLFEHIDRERWAEARAALASLLEQLGPDDPELVRARWLIDAEDA
ncbi:MAG: AAA family ATPase [Pseudomonadota bacterium]